MNRTQLLAVAAAATMTCAILASTANAQFVNRRAARWYTGAVVAGAGIDYGLRYGATTAADSYQRGMADVIRARGQAAESAARAARDREEARSRYIDNQTKWLEEYNQRKRIGIAQREAENARRRETIDRYRSARDSRTVEKPTAAQLDPDTGEINWPDALQQPDYQSGRARLEELFQLSKESGSSPAIGEEIQDIVSQMQARLNAHLRDYSANDFLAADRFLSALAASAAG